jgi:hypothetical protein
MDIDVTLADGSQVQAYRQTARFFKDDGADMVELSFTGSKDTIIHRVKPEHMAIYRQEWAAYCDGLPFQMRPGTDLLLLMDEQRAKDYIHKNVHNMEELAALNDAQCQALGHGTLTLREGAKKLLIQRALEAKERAVKIIAEKQAEVGPVPAEKYASQTDLAKVEKGLADLTSSVASLVEALAKKKPGRPKKEPE